MDAIKAHGTANDFVVFADLDDTLEVSADAARALTHRRTGVGGDGVIRLGAPPADQPDAHVFMDHRNADGSHAEMCGNGVRVVAKLAVDHGLVVPDGDTLRVATRGGTKPVTVHRDAQGLVAEVTVDMGIPETAPDAIPFELDGGDADALVHDVEVDGALVSFAVVSMGNPHAVVVVDDVATAPVSALGPVLETHRRFPAKVNVGFAQVLDRDAIRLRVWERGVGETAACGTGACAAVVALQRQGHLDDTVAVHLPGGTLTVTHPVGTIGTVTMRGPATEVARVQLDDTWLHAGSTLRPETSP